MKSILHLLTLLLFAIPSHAQPLYRHSIGLSAYTEKDIPEFPQIPGFRIRERFVCNGLLYRYHINSRLKAQASIHVLQRSVSDKSRAGSWYGKIKGMEYTGGIRYLRGWKHLGYITGVDVAHLSYQLRSVSTGNSFSFFYQDVDALQKITSVGAVAGIYIKPYPRVSIEGETACKLNFMHGEWDSGPDRTTDLIWLNSIRICYNWGKLK